MPPSKRHKETLRALCAQTYADDGVDPREDKKRNMYTTMKQDRKLEQLCKQVGHALQLILPGVQPLVDVTISNVVPAPNASRLRVTVAVTMTNDPAQTAAQLKLCGGYIRSELAQTISRRRVPELVFSVERKEVRDA